MSIKDKQGADELHRKESARPLDFAATPSQGPSSTDEEASWSEYRRRVRMVAKGLLNESEIEADDVAQAVILKAWQFRSHFRGESEFTTWLYRITIRTVSDFRRKLRRNTISLEDVSVDGLNRRGRVPEPHAPKVDIHKMISVEEKLKKLSPENARIMRLRLRGESPERIGHELGKSAEFVRQRISRGLRRLVEPRQQENLAEIESVGRKPPQSGGKARSLADSRKE